VAVLAERRRGDGRMFAEVGDEGFDVSRFRPRGLGEADLRGAVRAVAIGVDIGDLAAKAGVRVSRWDDIPPVSTSYSDARRALGARIGVFLEELKAFEARPGP
jgi:hypothetical protein